MKILKQTILFTVIAATTFSSCKKDDFAINTNPSAVTTSTVDYRTVLPATLASTATVQATQWKFLQSWLGFWARSGSYQSIVDEETYSFTNDFGVGVWNGLYGGASNYDFIEKNAKEKGAGTYQAIAKIMKSLHMQMLVDVYGNVPYSEAFQGAVLRTPKYDDDQAIYNALFRDLDAAIALLNNPTLSAPAANLDLAANDLIFQGNKTNWKKFANTIKLRMLMHTGNTNFAGGTEVNTFVAGINQTAEMAIIVAEGSGFLGTGLSAQINPGYNDTKPNPYYRAYILNETGSLPGLGDQTKANAYAVGPNPSGPSAGYYSWNLDPRINKFYGFRTGGTTHRGIPFGEIANFNALNGGNNLSTVNGPGLVPNGAASKAWIFTGTESLFLQAEAIRRGLMSGSAGTTLTAAIRESFVSLGLTTGDADAYILGNKDYIDVDYNSGPINSTTGLSGGMYTIISQKWFALNTFATLEVWTDYRRTNMRYGIESGFPEGPAISTNPSNVKTKIPIRLFYPQNEYSFNSASALGEGVIDVFTGGGNTGRNRIFWDQN